MSKFRKDLEKLINRYNIESTSDTPDFILAGYLIDSLRAFDNAVSRRERWYGRTSESKTGLSLEPVGSHETDPFAWRPSAPE